MEDMVMSVQSQGSRTWGWNVVRWAAPAMLLAWATSVHAAGIGFNAHFTSDYIWRGAKVVKGPAFQPQVDVLFPGDRVHVNVWATLGFQNDPERNGQPATAVDRIDVTLDYRHPIVSNILFFKVGGIYYINPGSDAAGNSRQETVDVFGGIIIQSLLPVDIHLDMNFDVDKTEQLYVALNVVREIPLGRFSTSFGVKTALTSTKPGGADSDADRLVGMSDTAVTGAVGIKIGWLKIMPQITRIFVARRASLQAADPTDDPGKDRFVFGVDFGFAH
jgi:hypothetical protein